MRITFGLGPGKARVERRDIGPHRRHEAFGIDAHPQHDGSDWGQEQPLALIEIRHCRGIGVLLHAESNPSIEIEHIGSTKDDAGGAHERHPARHLINSGQAQELTHEAAGPWQADRGHGEQQEEQRVVGHVDREAAVSVNLARVQPVIDNADA